MGWRNSLLSAIVLAACAAAGAQATAYKLGSTPTADQIRMWDITVKMDGAGLPAGHGTAAEGEKIYAEKCAVCHGDKGWGGEAPALILAKDAPKTPSGRQPHVFPTDIPFAPVLWDYIRRAMPMLIAPGSLKPDEVYSLVAFLFYKNGVIQENEVMDQQSLLKVKMPNRDGFVAPVLNSTKP